MEVEGRRWRLTGCSLRLWGGGEEYVLCSLRSRGGG